MKLALIGFGAMGQLVAIGARQAGDEIGLTLTSRDAALDAADLADLLHGHDAAIDFSAAGAVLRNVEASARAGVPVVEGTTGWNAEQEQVRAIVAQHGAALVYGANFSLGVNIFYRITACAAALFQSVNDYACFIEEAHHSRKRDAPSGTAIRLRELMSEHLRCDIPISSTRAGYIPGSHRVGFDSAADQITLTHTARNREGFAAGALVAARWIADRRGTGAQGHRGTGEEGNAGVWEFSQVIDEILKR